MEFTDFFKLSGFCKFSPDGEFLAAIFEKRLVIRSVHTLKITRMHHLDKPINVLEWSNDSRLIICASYKHGTVDVFDIDDRDWHGQISEGDAGLTSARWAFDSRHIVTVSEFQMRMTIWSLTGEEHMSIQYPKYSDKGMAFQSDGRYVAIVEKRDSKDIISIYDCKSWAVCKRIQPETIDLENLEWSPNGHYLAVWDTPLNYKLLIYTADGSLQRSYTAYEFGLGIKSVQWSPSSQFLAIGSYDQQIRFLNHYTWSPLIEFACDDLPNNPQMPIYCQNFLEKSKGRVEIHYEPVYPPAMIPAVKPEVGKPSPKLGVGMIKFNPNGRLVAVINESIPTCLWLIDIPNVRQICAIQQAFPIRAVQWNPINPDQVAFVCGGNHIYLWCEKTGCEPFEITTDKFEAVGLEWSPDGHSLIIRGKDLFCVAFPVHKTRKNP
ncbi:hypothetical protein K7432_007291 [Basidiobolus ranarum]|uniref:Translation initiation factor beta propellor-like domain-containing protein n=1 Tax=Basidiobolus ranarum TaxID=34480 RepID=A0ABR2WTQ1_9FUNG